MKKIIRLCSAVLVFVLIATLFVGMSASAASFSGGSGTKQDPYLLKTASDVQNIKNNLNSHFKLAATIDLGSIKEFEPIGCLGKPFTGTRSCDLGADGLPKYALLNLNEYNHAGEIGNHVFAQAGPGYYADYDTSNGNMVRIKHNDGSISVYKHGMEILVEVGQLVSKGDPILKVGSTGYSTGPHAHFEVRINGSTVDPLPYITSNNNNSQSEEQNTEKQNENITNEQ